MTSYDLGREDHDRPLVVAAFAARPSNAASGEVAARSAKSLRLNMFNPPLTAAGSGTNCAIKLPIHPIVT